MSSSPSASATAEVTPQQIGKAFVVQYYRLLHEHPESLFRFYSSSSTLMHDDPNKTVTGIENITKRIEELSLKQRHVKIRQVDCHSTVGSAVVVQVCGEISSASVADNQTPIMKRFVQTFVLAPTSDGKQKYYVHNDIFRYQDNPSSTTDNTKTTTDNEVASFGSGTTKQINVQSPTSTVNIQFADNTVTKKEEKTVESANVNENSTPVDEQQKTQSAKPKSYRDAIAKKEKAPASETTNEKPSTPGGTAATAASGTKPPKSGKQKSSKSANKNARAARGHPQDTNEYYDDSWYYGNEETGYLHTGYTDDQEIFVGNLSAQITEEEIHELFRSYGRLLLVRIGNTGSQVGAANFAFVVCESIEMAKAIVANQNDFFNNQRVNVEAKKRRPFSHTFRPTYPTAASPTNYQSTGYPAAYYEQAASAPFYDAGAAARGGRRGGRGGTH